MMKLAVIVTALVLAVVARPEEGFYSNKYDNFDAQELANNVRLLKAYGNCFLSKGPCTSEGTDFKKIVPDALKSSCGKCTPKQKELIRIVIKGFQSKLPDVWKELVDKEDPNKEYREAFNKFLHESD